MKKVKIEILKENFLSFNKKKLSNIIDSNDKYIFMMNVKDYNLLDDDTKKLILNIEYEDKVFNIIRANILYILTMLIMFIVLIIQNSSIREIHFTTDNEISESIIEIIDSNSISIGKYRFLKSSLTDLEKIIQNKYANYEFIGLEKKSAILEVEILESKDIIDNNVDNRIGDLIATKNAYIKGYKLTRGILMVEAYQVVSKGDLLVSGNLLIKKDGNYYVKAEGYVFGETITYQNVTIDKENYYYEETGNVEKKYKLSFFNKTFINKSNYEIYNSKYKVIFELKNFIKLTKIENVELVEIYEKNDKDSAKIKGMQLIEDEFNKTKLPEEKIINIATVSINEYDDYYEITYLVKKLENVATFNEVKD